MITKNVKYCQKWYLRAWRPIGTGKWRKVRSDEWGKLRRIEAYKERKTNGSKTKGLKVN